VTFPRSDASGASPGGDAEDPARAEAGGPAARSDSDATPLDGVQTPRKRPKRRDSEPPSFRKLTPYHARLDVEMDDTAVSKVRDPSASLRLGPSRNRRRAVGSRDAILATAFGALLGVLLVTAVALVAHACAGGASPPTAPSHDAR